MLTTIHKHYIAEALGAFILTASIGATLATTIPVSTPIVAGLTLTALVYLLGQISGAQLNPAVTLGLLSIGKISSKDALFYVIAQLVGGALAGVLLVAMSGGVDVAPAETIPAVAGEILGAFVLAFAVSAVVSKKVPDAAAGFAIGFSLLAGIVIASTGSLAILNPAVALGFGAYSFTYFLAPLVGGVFGARALRFLSEK